MFLICPRSACDAISREDERRTELAKAHNLRKRTSFAKFFEDFFTSISKKNVTNDVNKTKLAPNKANIQRSLHQWTAGCFLPSDQPFRATKLKGRHTKMDTAVRASEGCKSIRKASSELGLPDRRLGCETETVFWREAGRPPLPAEQDLLCSSESSLCPTLASD